jgi:hypothetical protein
MNESGYQVIKKGTSCCDPALRGFWKRAPMRE